MRDDGFERRRHVGPNFGDFHRLILQDRGNRIDIGFAFESAGPAKHFVQDRPEAENVGAVVHWSRS